jgi:hypothetical protein
VASFSWTSGMPGVFTRSSRRLGIRDSTEATMTPLPPPITREPGTGFVDYTVTQRFPKIVRDASEAVRDASKQRAMRVLLDQIVAGAPVDTAALARPTPFWSEHIRTLDGATWMELPFFDLEFVFYHALNSIAGFFENGTDVFRPIRDQALTAALEHFSPPDARLENALLAALFANEADFSLLSFSRGSAETWNERLLVDERSALTQQLENARTVHVIADNAGPELLADLALVNLVLARREEIDVVLHCKPWPMFVSDALGADVERALAALGGARDGRLRVESDAAWGEPRHFDSLPEPLVQALRSADVVIAKGDLNYRRFINDRAWPVETPVAEATANVPFTSHALRVLKSDALVGVPARAVARALSERADWRTAGVHAVIQKMK